MGDLEIYSSLEIIKFGKFSRSRDEIQNQALYGILSRIYESGSR